MSSGKIAASTYVQAIPLQSVPANKKLIRITTVPMALCYLLPGQMRFMSSNGFDVIMISADGKELPDVIAREQCPHIIVPMTRKITPWQDLKCLWQLIRIFRKEKPDIVHSHTPKAGLLGMLAARISGVKARVHTVAGLPLMTEKGFRLRLLTATEKITYAAATQVWPNSNSLLQYIRSHGLAAEKKLGIIGKGSSNGIDLQRFGQSALDETRIAAIRNEINYSPQNKYLLSIGRLVADKGIVELVNVFSNMRRNNPQLYLVLVGDFEPQLDPLPSETMQLIETEPGIIRISWTNAVECYMHIADIFVFPSHREGFPNVLLQAGAMQLPIICSGIAGNVDIVTNSETGLIFEKGNEASLQHILMWALMNPAALEQMAKKLQQEISENYRRENIWQNLLAAYKSLVN